MIDAKILATRSDDTDVEVWSVWIPRRGDNAIFTMEVAANFGSNVVVALYQKNYDEVGDGTSAGANMTFDQTTGRLSVTKLGSKEIVRFKLTIQRGGTLGQRRSAGSCSGSSSRSGSRRYDSAMVGFGFNVLSWNPPP